MTSGGRPGLQTGEDRAPAKPGSRTSGPHARRASDLLRRCVFDLRVRTAYRCWGTAPANNSSRVNGTFGCVRRGWEPDPGRPARPLATGAGRSTSYAETDAALTLLKKDPDLAFLS